MANGKLDLFQGGSLAKSIDVHLPDFQADIQLTGNTVNATSGIVEGIGPRYGFSPLAGHMDREAAASGNFPGLMLFETGTNNYTPATFWHRRGIFAIIPLTLKQPGDTGNIAVSETYYAYVVSYLNGVYGGMFMDVLLGATIPSSFIEHASNITSGLQYAGLDSVTSQVTSLTMPTLIDEKIVVPNSVNTTISNLVTGTGGLRDVLSRLLINSDIHSALPNTLTTAAAFSVTGPDIPMKWLLGGKTTTPDATHPPDLQLSYYAPGTPTYSCGIPSQFNYGNFPQNTRLITVYTLAQTAYGGITYQVNAAVTTSVYLPDYLESSSTAFDGSSFTWTKTGGTNYAAVDGALLNDEQITINSSYQGVAVASGKAIIVLYQDWYRGVIGEMQQYVDPTNMPQPKPNGLPRVRFAGANTGILRANTQYEFGFAIYDKRLNYETNALKVGLSTSFLTDATDYQAVMLFNGDTASTQAGVPDEAWASIPVLNNGYYTPTFPAAPEFTQPQHLNYLEYRFYFRQLGMSEWLPALFIDAAQYWFYPYTSGAPLLACVGAIGGLPGGRVGGFSDYSTLSADTYTCSVMYKNRLFWISEKALSFSLINNVFAYPGRNTAACPTGSFKGAIVHAYYGQAQQDARIVVFGTKATYVGKFTGNLIETPVTLSAGPPGGPPVVGNFGLDGSDFVLNAWTSVTAFSYRAAVVAEGILYFWGPQGVFMDDGVNPIQRISVPLEPDIFDLYDTSQTDQISCVYNDTTKEITWFFAPVSADASFPTHSLVWNRVKKSWLYVKYNALIDAAQIIATDTTGVATCGARTVVFARNQSATDTQRAYYYDQRNLCGDMLPGFELMVKAISTPVTGQRRLTLANGSTSISSIAAGDYIALQQCAAYAGTALTTPSDFIATVVARNTGAGTIDILLPPGATLDASATIASNANFFPIWHATPTARGLNGIIWTIDTKFWIPNGMSYWAFWLYIHLVYKLYDLLPGPAPTMSLNYQTPISAGNTNDAITLANNSQNNFQILHPLAPGVSNFEGQGLKLTFSGIQLAGSWVLQFLEAYAQLKDGMQLKQFEG